jgi:hypothetical protein
MTWNFNWITSLNVSYATMSPILNYSTISLLRIAILHCRSKCSLLFQTRLRFELSNSAVPQFSSFHSDSTFSVASISSFLWVFSIRDRSELILAPLSTQEFITSPHVVHKYSLSQRSKLKYIHKSPFQPIFFKDRRQKEVDMWLAPLFVGVPVIFWEDIYRPMRWSVVYIATVYNRPSCWQRPLTLSSDR